MDIKINGNTYSVPNSCPTDTPRKASLKRHLDEHGVESSLASNKYRQFASCVLDELQSMGAEPVETVEAPEQLLNPPETSSEAGSVPGTEFLETPGNTLEDSGDIYPRSCEEISPD